MPESYTVGENESLWTIAIAHGFYTVDPLVAANPDLGQSFASNFDVLSPGTALTIPDLKQKDVASAVDACHDFQVRRTVKDLAITVQAAD